MKGEMVSFYKERRSTFSIQRRDSLFVVDKVALLSLYRDTLSPILCEGEIVSLYIHKGKPPSLYDGGTRSTRYRKGASSLSIEEATSFSIKGRENVSPLYREDRDSFSINGRECNSSM